MPMRPASSVWVSPSSLRLSRIRMPIRGVTKL
jgi:hypothetical protein